MSKYTCTLYSYKYITCFSYYLTLEVISRQCLTALDPIEPNDLSQPITLVSHSIISCNVRQDPIPALMRGILINTISCKQTNKMYK